MQSSPVIDEPVDDVTSLLRELTSRSECRQQDLQSLAQALDRQGAIDRHQAAHFLHANRAMCRHRDDWVDVYLAVLTDFFLDYQSDRFILPDPSAELLLRWLGDETWSTHIGERRLTLRILLKARTVPEQFERYILDAIAESLIHGSDRWSGPGERLPGVIDALDLHMIGNLARPDGVQPPNTVSRSMISFLLDIDGRACRFTDPAAWQRLLIDCLVQRLSQASFGEDGSLSNGREAAERLNILLDGHVSPERARRLGHEVLSKLPALAPANV